MLVAIQANVAFEIILEAIQLPTSLHIQLIHDTLKNVWQQIFPTKREGRSDCTEVASLDNLKGFLNKPATCFRDCGRFEGCQHRNAPTKITEESIDSSSVGPALFHRAMIKLKMAGDPPSAIIVGFLGKHDLIDKAACLRISGDHPRHADAAKSLLQYFQQRHEIPHSENVVFHEESQHIEAIHLPVDAVVEQNFPQRVELFFNSRSKEQVDSRY